MEKNGLQDSITEAVADIAEGRKGLETDGKEHEGRLAFEKGVAKARAIFAEVLASGDVELMLLAEYLFITQELEESEDDEVEGRASAVAALVSFDDAFLSLKALEKGAAYQVAEQTYPHNAQYRYKDMPKDAFHIAFIAHKTRLRNSISRMGLSRLDRTLVKERIKAIATTQDIYFKKQQLAIKN
jgi:Zn-dependent M28 family amino/carboxypeptidase